MGTFINTVFNHWQTTLMGVATSVLEYFAHPFPDAGIGWQVVALVAPIVLGAIAKDAHKTAEKDAASNVQ